MSSSPPKKGEPEEGEQSPQENTEQGTAQGPMDPSDTQGQGTEVEVKEQKATVNKDDHDSMKLLAMIERCGVVVSEVQNSKPE